MSLGKKPSGFAAEIKRKYFEKDPESRGGNPDVIFMDPKSLEILKKSLNRNKSGLAVGDWCLLDNETIVEVRNLLEGRMVQVSFVETEKPYNFKGRQVKILDKHGYIACVNVDSQDLIKVPKGATLKAVKVLYGNK